MTQQAQKPLPTPQPESDAYWAAAARGELLVQSCADCGDAQFYPRNFCLACGSRNVEFKQATGRATLYTFAIVHQPPHPGFAGDVPYIAAIVELEEGVRMPTNIVGIEPDPENLSIGMRLVAEFEPVSDGIALPKFRPA
jgi:hypothetical protein